MPYSEERINEIFNKTNGRCFICGKHLSFSNRIFGDRGAWHVGHLISKAKGGSDNLRNLVPLCAPCNLTIGTMGVRYYIEHYTEPKDWWEGLKDFIGVEPIRRRTY